MSDAAKKQLILWTFQPSPTRTPGATRPIQAVLDALAFMLRPIRREQVKSPHDIAAVFMLEMAHLDQEQLRVACLNTRNRLQKIHLVYQGSLNTSMIRVGEI